MVLAHSGKGSIEATVLGGVLAVVLSYSLSYPISPPSELNSLNEKEI